MAFSFDFLFSGHGDCIGCWLALLICGNGNLVALFREEILEHCFVFFLPGLRFVFILIF